ncbi:MAG: porin [Gammaproteobacteria bacterium]
MWTIIQKQQQLIDNLKTELEKTQKLITRTQSIVDDNREKVEATADVVEQVTSNDLPAARRQRTTIGGYGELHYNNLDDDKATIGGDDSTERTDFHRFVLYFGHEFSDQLRFFSELELEHAFIADTGGSTAGEVELEQAWVELDINDQHHFRAGLDILPIGIINPTHEPNTFYGVERNHVETEIIPATWWEAGMGSNGELAPGWNYDAVIHSGLVVPTSGSSAFRPRSGRLKVAEADDQDLAFTGRLRFTGIPGLELGISGQYQADITGTADAFNIGATLFEGHIDWKHATGIGLRALYARWDIGSDKGLDPGALNADNLEGWYVEPAYRFKLPGPLPGELGVFTRYSQWDERNQISGVHRFEEFEQFTVGFNWWPHSHVAFKFDAQFENANAPVDKVLDGINLGVGYQF